MISVIPVKLEKEQTSNIRHFKTKRVFCRSSISRNSKHEFVILLYTVIETYRLTEIGLSFSIRVLQRSRGAPGQSSECGEAGGGRDCWLRAGDEDPRETEHHIIIIMTAVNVLHIG